MPTIGLNTRPHPSQLLKSAEVYLVSGCKADPSKDPQDLDILHQLIEHLFGRALFRPQLKVT